MLIDRADYWQTAYLVPEGGFETVRAGGLSASSPCGVNRLARWHRPGLLLIGDAARAMSPIGGASALGVGPPVRKLPAPRPGR